MEELEKQLELSKEDRIFVKVVEDYKGDDWLIGFGKDAETDKEYHICTNRVHASEAGFSTAKKDAELLCKIWNLILNDKFNKQKAFLKEKLTEVVEGIPLLPIAGQSFRKEHPLMAEGYDVAYVSQMDLNKEYKDNFLE